MPITKHASARKFLGLASLSTAVAKQPSGNYKATAKFNGKDYAAEGMNQRVASLNLRQKIEQEVITNTIPV